MFLQQSCAGHDHAGRAIPALHGVSSDECFLNGVQVAVRGQALDGGDGFAGHGGCARDAGTDWRAIDQHRASAALAFAASVFAAGESEIVAQDPQQPSLGMNFEPEMLLIDDEFHTLSLRPFPPRP